MAFRRPEDYAYLSPDQIYDLIEDRGLTEARRAYQARYGRPYADKRIAAEIDDLFRDWAKGYFDENEDQFFDPTINLPPHLVLVFLLHEGSGRGRGRLPMPPRERVTNAKMAYRINRELKKRTAERKDELIAAGKDKRFAALQAREDALKALSKEYGLSENTIERPDRKGRRRRPSKRA